MMQMFQQMKGKGGGGGGGAWGGNKGGGWKSRDPEKTVWVGGVPEGITEDELKENFKSAGPIKQLNLTKGGTGIVEYNTAAAAQQAITMFNGADVNGSLLQVDA